ncbi:nucleotidyltransferase domain-containing protein [Candidatus Pacearchaeota archaeon]|nr:nucleotidyltransferase domain-containing protein [Candidatus Pacearchaeota archaeon]
MEIQIKKAVKAGNSSVVVLPRAWLGKEVRIELVKKTSEIILLDVIEILKRHIKSSEIIGIYLTGSYARGDNKENSDIDILVITANEDKEIIHEGSYSILIVSHKLLEQKLKEDLLPIGQMIKEAKPLLNSYFLNSIKIRVTKENVRWHLNTSDKKLKILKKALDIGNKYVDDRIIYTLVLRIRTLYIIKTLIENKDYSKEEFENTINKISNGKTAYERYLAVKNNSAGKNNTKIQEAKRLYDYLKNRLKEVKNLLNYSKRN